MERKLPLALMGVEVGVVLSGATASLAPIALRRDAELQVKEEDLALIVDKSLDGYYMLGVVRWIRKYEPFLRSGAHNVYVEHPEALEHDLVMPFTNAYVEIYAGLCENPRVCGAAGMAANTYAPTPSSRVFKVVEASRLTSYLEVQEPLHVGEHKYSGWRMPLDASKLAYHVGVFGATGSGKSRLVLKLVSEASRWGYSFVVFDHTGVDYAPFAAKGGIRVVGSREVMIPPLALATTIVELTGLHSSSQYADYVEIATVCHDKLVRGEVSSVRECLKPNRQSGSQEGKLVHRGSKQNSLLWSKESFLKTLEEVCRALGARDSTIFKLKFYIDYYVPSGLFESMESRKLRPMDIVDLALKEGVVVVDLSSERSISVKRAVLFSVAEAAWSRIGGRPLKLGLVVDEAQNYACERCGPVSQALEDVAREGRKWGYFLVLASQRVARDLRTGIRCNLGTVFFSKLQAQTDLQELSGYLDLGRVSEASLAMLSTREFYVAGLMNPLRRPMLLRVEEVHGFHSLEGQARAGTSSLG